jgi:integrase/recombinase XerD
MRLGEAIRLDRSDLDSDNGVLVVGDSKCSKSRESTLHPSTFAALSDYQHLVDERFPGPRRPGLLVSTRGSRLVRQNIEYVFPRLGAPGGSEASLGSLPSQAPRLCRHSLAIHTLCWTGIAKDWTCNPGCCSCPPS